MSINISSDSVLKYWNHYANLQHLNLLTEDDVQLVELKDNQLLSNNEKGDIWLSPFSFKRDGHMIMPVWLPVHVEEDGRLSPPENLALPHIPDCYSDPLGHFGKILENREIIDASLLNHFIQDGVLQQNLSWEVYLQKAKNLFDDIKAQNNIESSFQHIWSHQTPEIAPKGLSTPLLNTAPAPNEKNLEKPISLNGLLSPTEKTILSDNFIETALHVLAMPKGAIQSVMTPLASPKAAFLETLLLSLQSVALNKNNSISVCVVTKKKITPISLCFDNKDFLEKAQVALDTSFNTKDEAYGALKAKWQTIQSHLKKTFKALSIDKDKTRSQLEANQTKLGELQDEDEKLERLLSTTTKALRLWREKSKISFFTRLKRLLTGFDYDIFCAEFISEQNLAIRQSKGQSLEDAIILKMRRIKVKRTKIHQAITQLGSDIGDYQGALRTYDKCIAEYPQIKELKGLAAFNHIFKQHNELQKQLAFCLATMRYELKVDYISHDALLKHEATQSKYDWVIFNDANALLPKDAMGVLNIADRAIMLGDPKLGFAQGISMPVDELLVKHFGLIDHDDDFEDLQFAGHVLSQSSLYHMAIAHDWYTMSDASGMITLQALRLRDIFILEPLSAFYKSLFASDVQLHTGKDQSITFHDVAGDFNQDNPWQNEQQAIACLKHIQENLKADSVIVTLSVAQKELMEQKAKAQGILVRVKTLEQFNESARHVVFSTVYNASASRPHYLDCGEAPLYKLFSLTLDSLHIFADKSLLNAKTHSPMGQLAKLLEASQTTEPEKMLDA